MVLEITSTQVVGQSAEIVGRTEPGAALIINGQSVPNIAPDGNFRHFTDKLAPGQHTISIIGANRRGGTATKQVSIVVPKYEFRRKTQAPLRWSWCPETIGIEGWPRWGQCFCRPE